MCKKSGSWTTKLYAAAQSVPEHTAPRKVKVHVEGPYGGPGHTIVPSFSSALIVVGGSGITYGLSTVQDLINKGEACVSPSFIGLANNNSRSHRREPCQGCPPRLDDSRSMYVSELHLRGLA